MTRSATPGSVPPAPAPAPPTACDAVVIGAGPAGGLAALSLARAGHRVLLIEKRAWPRPKVCGCCLNAAALVTLHRAGLGDPIAALRPPAVTQLHLQARGRTARVPLPPGVSLSRPALDGLLVDAACAAGATFRPRSTARVGPTLGPDATRTVVVDGRPVRARTVVVADGLGGTALRDLPAFAVTARPNARVGVGVHLPADHPVGDRLPEHGVLMLCGRRGYLGLVRLEDGTLDAAAAADRPALREAGGPAALVRALALDAGLPPTAWPAARDGDAGWRVTPALTRARRTVAAPGLFVVGDAAGYVEPFTGEGMAWALAGGAAVAALADEALAGRRTPAAVAADWPVVLRRTVARRQRGCRLVAGLLRRPRLTRAVIAAVSRVPALARPLVPARRDTAPSAPPRPPARPAGAAA